MYRAQIDADGHDAITLGVAATPAFFINGRPLNGSQGVKIFVELVETELARAKSTPGGYDVVDAAGSKAAVRMAGAEGAAIARIPPCFRRSTIHRCCYPR